MGLPYSTNINAITGKENDATGTTAVTIANTAAYLIDLSKRQLASIQFNCLTFSSGSGAFGMEVSNDGTNWVVYNRLTGNLTNSNVQNDTRTAAPTLSSATSQIFFIADGDYFRYARVFVTVAGTGTYNAIIQAAG